MDVASVPLAQGALRDVAVRGDGYAALVRRIQALVRVTVPWSDPVAVVSGGDEALLDLEGRYTVDFPGRGQSSATPQLASSAEAIAALEVVRRQGVRFLLIPATTIWWLDTYTGFRRHLETNYRSVVRSEDCVLFSLRWPEDGAFRNAGAEDGLPLPPPELIRITVSNEDARRFCASGQEGAAWIESLLSEHRTPLESVGSLLDFGCGAGRVLRQWKRLRGVQVTGTDYNPVLVAWCREHLPFAELVPLSPDMALQIESDSLGLIYALSVFTHIDEQQQAACMREFTRLLRPGGLLLLTINGPLDWLSDEERQRFDAGEFVIRGAEHSGSNACRTYHPEQYVRKVFASDLELVDFSPGRATDIKQDTALLRKPTPV
jgi:SAM-dependent methyltransferase